MLLGFDIGNSNTVMSIYSHDDAVPKKIFRFSTERNAIQSELGQNIIKFLNIYQNENQNNFDIDGFAFSSVVPEVNDIYSKISKKYFKTQPLEIDSSVKLSIEINYDYPEQLGSDRIVNAEAAYREYKEDCIIIDLGTAITFCVLHREGLFDGGLISPGIGIAANALASKASKLSRVEFEKPENIVAKNTVDAIKSGIFYGWLSMIEGIISRIETLYNKRFLNILTGGYAEIVGKYLQADNIIDSLLTLKGIKYVYDLNNKFKR